MKKLLITFLLVSSTLYTREHNICEKVLIQSARTYWHVSGMLVPTELVQRIEDASNYRMSYDICHLDYVILDARDLHDVHLRRAFMSFASLTNSNLNNVNLENSTLNNTIMFNNHMNHINLSHSNADGAQFFYNDMTNANAHYAKMRNGNF